MSLSKFTDISVCISTSISVIKGKYKQRHQSNWRHLQGWADSLQFSSPHHHHPPFLLNTRNTLQSNMLYLSLLLHYSRKVCIEPILQSVSLREIIEWFPQPIPQQATLNLGITRNFKEEEKWFDEEKIWPTTHSFTPQPLSELSPHSLKLSQLSTI